MACQIFSPPNSYCQRSSLRKASTPTLILFICNSFISICLFVAADPAVYSHDFAVEIHGGPENAARVAGIHGFLYKGQIGTLENMYLLQHPRLSKRSLEPADESHHATLAADESVLWFEQQKVKIRTKRGLDDENAFGEVQNVMQNHFLGKSYRSSVPRLRQYRDLHANQDETLLNLFLPHNFANPSAEKRIVIASGVDHNDADNVIGRDTVPVNFKDREREEKPYFSDPLFLQQWYLNHGAAGSYDMNVVAAWKRGYSGKGVSVTILDDGLQPTHPDIQQNYDPLASLDINGGDDDPTPTDDNNNKHGTRCAGEVAAVAGNEHCGVGVAYNSSIGGVRMLDGDIHDAVEATALSHHPQHIDIYSASWGPNDDGRTVDGPGPLAVRAFEQGIRYGRRGLGSIFVWASGNGGKHDDRCSCDGYTNSIYTLSISSAAEDGGRPWYLEECASTLATTYSSGSRQQRSIVTIDLNTPNNRFQECTERHTGTSASAPLAAGLIALAMEANRNLTWRDMQHIVLLSANPMPLIDTDWRNNSLGRKFSHKFGYGLMDADAMTRLAEKWQTVSTQLNCSTQLDASRREISEGKLLLKIRADLCQQGEENSTHINYLEHVQARLTINSVRRGNIFVQLTSPRGTVSDMLQLRQFDMGSESFRDWPFMSVHFFGEDPRGEWILEVRDKSYDPLNSLMSSHSSVTESRLVFFGTNSDPVHESIDLHALGIKMPNLRRDAEQRIAAAERKLAEKLRIFSPDLIQSRQVEKNAAVSTDSCHITCRTCHTSAHADACTTCFADSGWFLHAGTCVKQCPSGFQPDSGLKNCVAVENIAAAVNSHKSECPHGQFFSHRRSACLPCSSECAECSSGPEHCTKCSAAQPVLHESKCLIECPPGFFVAKPNGTFCLREGHFKNPIITSSSSPSLVPSPAPTDADNEVVATERKRSENVVRLRSERDNAVIHAGGMRFHVVSMMTRLLYAGGFISIAGLILCCVYTRATGRGGGLVRKFCCCCNFVADWRRTSRGNIAMLNKSIRTSKHHPPSTQARYKVIRDIDNVEDEGDDDDEEEQIEFSSSRSYSHLRRPVTTTKKSADVVAVSMPKDEESDDADDEFDVGGDMLKRINNKNVYVGDSSRKT